MTYPRITIHDAATGETVEREMTDEEYEALVASGWTPGDEPTSEPEPTPEEETATE